MIKLLIADDSALMRKLLGDIFRAEGDFEVHLARNGSEALQLAKSLAPDVITLDINMPEMDGITCLSHIMVECPKPVLMVSSLTTRDAEITLEALELGAVDVIPKPDGTVSLHIDQIRVSIVAKVRTAARTRLRLSKSLTERVRHTARSSFEKGPAAPPQTRPTSELVAREGEPRGVVLIGVSTGGPGALEAILPRLPKALPWPVVVAQHMPESFTGVFARRIDTLSALTVCEVSRPLPLRAGTVYVARGDADLLFARRAGVLSVLPTPAAPEVFWHPSVDRMVRSAMEHVSPANLLGVLLTGMGDDGAAAMAGLRSGGGRTIAESEETAIVWGMPGELVRRGGASVVLPVQQIAEKITQWAG